MSWKSAATILFTLLALYAPTAAASDVFTGLSEGTRVYLEPDNYGPEVTFDLVAQVEVLPKLMLDADVPWAVDFAELTGDKAVAHAALGDMRLGAHTAVHVTPNVVLHIGGSVSAPTDTGGNASFDAKTVRDFFDQDRFLEQALSIRVPFGAEFRFGPFFYLRSDLTPVVFVAVGHAAAFTGAQEWLEHSDEVELRSRGGWGGGVRFQLALPLSPGRPFGVDQLDGQLALGPFVGLEPPDHGVFARLGVLCNPSPRGYEVSEIHPVAQLRVGYKY